MGGVTLEAYTLPDPSQMTLILGKNYGRWVTDPNPHPVFLTQGTNRNSNLD